jgi:hypothetical protein
MNFVASQTQIAVKQKQPYGIGLSMKCVASQTQLVHKTQIFTILCVLKHELWRKSQIQPNKIQPNKKPPLLHFWMKN